MWQSHYLGQPSQAGYPQQPVQMQQDKPLLYSVWQGAETAMMSLSLEQQKQIPTAPLADKRNTLAYLDAGYKICVTCQKFVKWLGKHCPFCRKQMRVRPRASRARRRYSEARASGQTFTISYQRKRNCSQCGSENTGKLKRGVNGSPMPHWMTDGKGGYLCNRCYQHNRKRRHKADLSQKQA